MNFHTEVRPAYGQGTFPGHAVGMRVQGGKYYVAALFGRTCGKVKEHGHAGGVAVRSWIESAVEHAKSVVVSADKDELG